MPHIGRFDHLYINFTTRLPEGHSRFISDLPVCRGEFDWYRYVDVGVSEETFRSLRYKTGEWYLQTAVDVITTHFCHTEDERTAVYRLLDDITAKGSDFETLYKVKETSSFTVQVCTAVEDDMQIIPHVRVTDRDGNVLLDRRMDCMDSERFINQFGTLLVSSKRVAIRPRKNEFTKNMKEIILPIGEE